MEKHSNNGTASAKNGAANSAQIKAAGEVLKVTPKELTTEAPKVMIPQPEPVTLVSQRDKLERLNLLFEKEAKLANSKREIDRFKLATDESTNSLELKDGKGATFRTCNPMVIKSVIDLVVQELAAKQTNIANDIIAIG